MQLHKVWDLHITRLEILCALHNVQGGTIHQYNAKYGVDFIDMDKQTFSSWIDKLLYKYKPVIRWIK